MITSAGATTIRSVLRGRYMPHTYTLTRDVDSGDNDQWDNPITEPGTPQEDRPCRYTSEDRVSVQDTGQTLVGVPTLTVPWDDDIREGDSISEIKDADGTSLYDGTGVVDFVQPAAGLGRILLKRAVLRTAGAMSGLP